MTATKKNRERLTFRDRRIRAVRDLEGNLRLCLKDLCEALGCEESGLHATDATLLPTLLSIPFGRGQQHLQSIRPIDIRRLLQSFRKENGPRFSRLYDQMETWANALREREEVSTKPIVPYRDEVRVFDERISVTFRIEQQRIMVNATQITVPFGKLPSAWLRISATDSLRREFAKQGLTAPYQQQIFTTLGRNQGATWLEAPLLVPLAQWIAPGTGLDTWCREQVEALSRQFGRRLVPLRSKHAPRIPCLDDPIPQTVSEAAAMIEELRRIVRENVPKVTFYEEFIENRDWFKSSRIADELGTTANQLHLFLAEQGICKYEKRQWAVFSPYKALQCDVPIQWTNFRGKVYTLGFSKRWTQAGREYILDLWRQHHGGNS